MATVAAIATSDMRRHRRGARCVGSSVAKLRHTRSRTMATATIASPAAMPRPVRRCERLWNTFSPSPPAPISAASTTMPRAIMIVWVRPVMMVGSAIGICTLSSVCRRVAPKTREASIACWGT